MTTAAPTPLDHADWFDALDPALKSAPTAQERCDRCAAHAKVRAFTPGGGMLLFCRHCVGGVDGAKKASQPPSDSDGPGVTTRRGLVKAGALLVEF